MSIHYVTLDIKPEASPPTVGTWAIWDDDTAAGAGFSADGSVNEDPDGQYNPIGRATLDLSHALSQKLGKQFSQSDSYRVRYLSVGLRNVDDMVDNESAMAIGGKFYWFAPTHHRLEAMKIARMIEKHDETDEVDVDGYFLPLDPRYKGLRFNYSADNQVALATPESVGLSPGFWNLTALFQAYSEGIQGGTPNVSNALWEHRCALTSEAIAFEAAWSNNAMHPLTGLKDFNDVETNDFQMVLPGRGFECLAGLLRMSLTHSNTNITGLVDDDFSVVVTVGVEVNE